MPCQGSSQEDLVDLRDGDFCWGGMAIPERDMVYFPEELISLIDLKPGEVVADLDPGAGYWTFHFAEAVGPEGRVYAITLHPVASPNLDVYMAEKILDPEVNPYRNIILVRSPHKMGLPKGSIDLAFLSLTTILVQDPDHPDFKLPADDAKRREREAVRNASQIVVKSIYEALKPGGRLVLIEPLDHPLFYTTRIPVFSNALLYREFNANFPKKSIEEVGFIKRNFEKIGFRFLRAHDIYSNEFYRSKVEEFKALPIAEKIFPWDLQIVYTSEKLVFVFEKPENDNMPRR